MLLVVIKLECVRSSQISAEAVQVIWEAGGIASFILRFMYAWGDEAGFATLAKLAEGLIMTLCDIAFPINWYPLCLDTETRAVFLQST